MREFFTKDATEMAIRLIGAFVSASNDSTLDREKMELAIVNLFDEPQNGVHIIERLDLFVDRYPGLEILREYLVDLAGLKVLASEELNENEDEDEEMDSGFEERGSELIMFFLYIRDCFLAGIPPTLPDFLYNFVLDEDDTSQEAFYFYEDFIRNQDLVDTDVMTIIEKGNEVKGNPGELFTPIFCFFYKPDGDPAVTKAAIAKKSRLAGLHTGLFEAMFHFYLWNKVQ